MVHHQRPEQFAEAAGELGQVGTGIRHPPHDGKHLGGLAIGNRGEEGTVFLIVHEAEGLADASGGEDPFPEGEALVEHRQGVPHAAVGVARDQPQRVVFGVELFRREHLAQPIVDCDGPDPAEIEPLQARHHRGGGVGDLLGFRGGKHEDHTGWWFLENLQQHVPRFAREHVRFVHDVDLVMSGLRRRVHGALAQVTGIVHTAVGRCVDLHHVEVGGAVPDLEARRTLAARLAVGRASLAVERHGKDAGGSRLAHPAGTGEQVAVADAPLGHGTAQGGGDVILHHEIGESAGAVAAGEGDGH